MIMVNATLEPKEGKTAEIIEKADTLLKASREHKGNVSYNLYENVEDNTLMFVERWKCLKGLQKHMQTEEFLSFGQEIKDLLKSELSVKIYEADLLTDDSVLGK